jgi:ribosome-binding protein aMBF1 (putative translation factor)
MALSTKIVRLTPTIVNEGGIVPAVASKKEETNPVYDLIQAREDELGLSIRELGARTGIDHTTIAKNKKGDTDPLKSTIIKLAKVANVSPTVMFEAFLGKIPDAARRQAQAQRP